MEYITHVGSDGRKLGQPPNKTGSRTQNSVQPSQGTKRKPSHQRTAAVNTVSGQYEWSFKFVYDWSYLFDYVWSFTFVLLIDSFITKIYIELCQGWCSGGHPTQRV